MGGLTPNKMLSILALGAMVGLLLLPIVVSMPALAGGGGTPAAGGPPPDVAKKYDQLAYDFIKISLTAYSLTAILGGILIFTFLTLYPAFFGYLSSIFRPVMHIYALLFVAESGTIYIYYYGWDRMKEGLLKWIHVSMSVVLNVIGTTLMFLANSWIGFMMSPAGVDEQGRFLGNIWHSIHTALWNPLNVHRRSEEHTSEL